MKQVNSYRIFHWEEWFDEYLSYTFEMIIFDINQLSNIFNMIEGISDCSIRI